jgi:hypothetical protein
MLFHRKKKKTKGNYFSIKKYGNKNVFEILKIHLAIKTFKKEGNSSFKIFFSIFNNFSENMLPSGFYSFSFFFILILKCYFK